MQKKIVFCTHAYNVKNSQLILWNANFVITVNVEEMQHGGKKPIRIPFGVSDVWKRHGND